MDDRRGTQWSCLETVDSELPHLLRLDGCRPRRCDTDATSGADLGQVRGLVFNPRNVLFDDTSWRRWLLQLLHRMGVHTHYDAFFRLWDAECLPQVRRGEIAYWDALKAYLSSIGMTRGQLQEVEAAGRLRRERFLRETRPFPVVAVTLARLTQAGVRMVAVDSVRGEIEDACQPLRAARLDRWFERVLVSEASDDAGGLGRERKYRVALEVLGGAADRIALVGHDPLELETAASLGMRTVGLNMARDARADCLLSHLSDVPTACGLAMPWRRAG